MKTVLIGFSEITAQTKPTSLVWAGDEDQKNWDTFLKAKNENKYPKDVVCFQIWGEQGGLIDNAICHKAWAKAEDDRAKERKDYEAKSIAQAAKKKGDEEEAAGKLRSDGPTLEEYVAAGYKAEGYPPEKYAPKDSPAYDALQKEKAKSKAGT